MVSRCISAARWSRLGESNPSINQAKHRLTCGFAPARSDSVPLVTYGFGFGS